MKKIVKILALASVVLASASCCGGNAEKNASTDNNNTIMTQSSNFIFEIGRAHV